MNEFPDDWTTAAEKMWGNGNDHQWTEEGTIYMIGQGSGKEWMWAESLPVELQNRC